MSNSTPRKGSDPSCSVSIGNFTVRSGQWLPSFRHYSKGVIYIPPVKRDNIVITKPDEGSGVAVMDKSQYHRLLSQASINDTSKFKPVSLERPKTKGRPPTYYHPLLQKKKEICSLLGRILPKPIATLFALKVLD